MNKRVVAIIATVLIVAGLCKLLIWNGFIHPAILSDIAHRNDMNCQVNVKRLSFGVLMYAEDWDSRLPFREKWTDVCFTSKYGDVDANVFHCPNSKSQYGYALNAAISGIKLAEVTNLDKTILLFEMDSDKPNPFGNEQNLTIHSRHVGRDVFATLSGRSIVVPRGNAINWKVKFENLKPR